MSREEVQTIIDDKNFTLLADVEGLGVTSMQEQKEIERKQKITEMRRDINNAEFLLRNPLDYKAVKAVLSLSDDKKSDKEKGGAPKLPLSNEELKLRWIKLCATSVVLSSIGLVVIY